MLAAFTWHGIDTVSTCCTVLPPGKQCKQGAAGMRMHERMAQRQTAYCVTSVKTCWGLGKSPAFLQCILDGYSGLHDAHFQHPGQGSNGRVLHRRDRGHDCHTDGALSRDSEVVLSVADLLSLGCFSSQRSTTRCNVYTRGRRSQSRRAVCELDEGCSARRCRVQVASRSFERTLRA